MNKRRHIFMLKVNYPFNKPKNVCRALKRVSVSQVRKINMQYFPFKRSCNAILLKVTFPNTDCKWPLWIFFIWFMFKTCTFYISEPECTNRMNTRQQWWTGFIKTHPISNMSYDLKFHLKCSIYLKCVTVRLHNFIYEGKTVVQEFICKTFSWMSRLTQISVNVPWAYF